jgi:C-terminal processing protease CtpA/Prc
MELEKNSMGQWMIAAVRPGGPVDLTNLLMPGDTIVSVEWNNIQVSSPRRLLTLSFSHRGFSLQGRSETEVNQLLFGKEGTSVTIEVVSPRGRTKHATMVRVRANVSDAVDPDDGDGERTFGTMCCRT